MGHGHHHIHGHGHAHDHSHDHESAPALPAAFDASVPDEALTPEQQSRRTMLRRTGLLGAGLAAGSVLATTAGSTAAAAAPAAPLGSSPKNGFLWLVSDHHIHTQYSNDGKYRVVDQVRQGAKHGMDWLVITDHGNVTHAKIGVEKVNPDIRDARDAYEDTLVFQGLEWNIPGAEHGTVFVHPGKNEVSVLKQFETDYDGSVKGASDSTPANEALAIAGLNFLAQQVQRRKVKDALMLANHPARRGVDSPHEIRGWRDATGRGHQVAVGFEGAPGHQAGGIAKPLGMGRARGIYDNNPSANSFAGYPLESYRTWGGFDWMTATVGGLWDSLLAEGKPWWITANSDSHNVYTDTAKRGGPDSDYLANGKHTDPVYRGTIDLTEGDYWPGQYSRTHCRLRRLQLRRRHGRHPRGPHLGRPRTAHQRPRRPCLRRLPLGHAGRRPACPQGHAGDHDGGHCAGLRPQLGRFPAEAGARRRHPGRGHGRGRGQGHVHRADGEGREVVRGEQVDGHGQAHVRPRAGRPSAVRPPARHRRQPVRGRRDGCGRRPGGPGHRRRRRRRPVGRPVVLRQPRVGPALVTPHVLTVDAGIKDLRAADHLLHALAAELALPEGAFGCTHLVRGDRPRVALSLTLPSQPLLRTAQERLTGQGYEVTGGAPDAAWPRGGLPGSLVTHRHPDDRGAAHALRDRPGDRTGSDGPTVPRRPPDDTESRTPAVERRPTGPHSHARGRMASWSPSRYRTRRRAARTTERRQQEAWVGDCRRHNQPGDVRPAVGAASVRPLWEAPSMDSSNVIETLWDRIQARDWAGVAELLAEDVVVEWPISLERIIGRENFVAVNREYPEGWSIRVLKVVAEGEEVVSEVEVPHDSLGVFRAASFWTVRDGQIVRGTEYWTSLGADPRPEWRAAFVESM